MTVVYIHIPTDPSFTSYTKHWRITKGKIVDDKIVDDNYDPAPQERETETYQTQFAYETPSVVSSGIAQSYDKLNDIFQSHIDQFQFHDIMIKLPIGRGKSYRLWSHTFKGIGIDRRKNPYARYIDLHSDLDLWEVPYKNREGFYYSHSLELMSDY
jgi:hypothetical protein